MTLTQVHASKHHLQAEEIVPQLAFSSVVWNIFVDGKPTILC
jgi:hypothetical protein